jgi:hypothetical protein
MVLSRLFSRRDKEESFEIDNPNEGGYEDCLSCRVLGMMRSNFNFESFMADFGTSRLNSAGITRRIHILQRHEKSQAAEESNRDEQIEIQVRLSTVRHFDIISYSCRYGTIQDVQLIEP